jgi:RHS repeat-associated protein
MLKINSFIKTISALGKNALVMVVLVLGLVSQAIGADGSETELVNNAWLFDIGIIALLSVVVLLRKYWSSKIRSWFYGLGVYALLLAPSTLWADTMYFVHADNLNTPQAVTNSDRQTVWSGDYEPYGVVDDRVGAVEFNVRFPGQYEDAEVGLYQNYYRDYDSATGRYIQTDPIGLEGGFNLYAYSLQNPISMIDPLGQNSVTGSWLRAPGIDNSNVWSEWSSDGKGGLQLHFYGIGEISWTVFCIEKDECGKEVDRWIEFGSVSTGVQHLLTVSQTIGEKAMGRARAALFNMLKSALAGIQSHDESFFCSSKDPWD